MYNKAIIEPEIKWELAIFDTESDQFVTSSWSRNMCNKILTLWQNRHPEMNMSRFELRHRPYPDEIIDNSVVLVVDKNTNQILTYFHWDNRGYANGFEDTIRIHYYPPTGKDMTEIMERDSGYYWDGKNGIVKYK